MDDNSPSTPDASAAAVLAPHVDVAFYRATYPDIARTALDPVLHYAGPGWHEGRRPNAWFDTQYYLQSNPDIRAAGINPLLHYVTHGRREGRHPRRPGGELRVVVDRALPPGSRKTGYDAPPAVACLDRVALAAALAAACLGARGLVASASHDRYIDITGGVQIFIADEQMLFNGDRFAYLHLSPAIARLTLAAEATPDDDPALLQLVLDGDFIGLATAEAVTEALGGLPEATAPVRLFVVHSLFGHRASVLMAVAEAMRAAHRCFWLHDYAAVCEGFNLLRDDAVFCGAPPPDSMACRICVYGGRRREYRAALLALFEAVGFDVLAPSRAALEQFLAAADLPSRSTRVHPNLRLEPETGVPTPADPPVRVAFVGYPLAHKGWPLFRDLVQSVRAFDAYRFHHFSTDKTLQPMDRLVCVPVQVDRYDRFAAVAALRAHAIDLVVLLSPWPETFSYVTHEALAAGADVIALAGSGNVADVVRAQGRGLVLPDAEAVLSFFADLHAVRYAAERRRAGIRPGLLQVCGTTATVDFANPGDFDRLATDDPDLQVIAGTRVIAPSRAGEVWTFDLPQQGGTVRLVSRRLVPAALRQGETEQRRLGVAIRELRLDGTIVPAGDPRRLTGWHGAEAAWEWTSGDATLAAGTARRLDVTLARRLRYVRTPFAASV